MGLELGACLGEGGRFQIACWCGEEGAWTRVVKRVTEEGKEGVNDHRFLSWTSGGCLHFLKYGAVVGWGASFMQAGFADPRHRGKAS